MVFRARIDISRLLPASAVFIRRDPEELVYPLPLITFTVPPVVAVVSPAVNEISPPTLVLPDPTTTLTLPPFPLVADPVDIDTNPLLPLLVVPVPNFKNPEMPFVPALVDRTSTLPLDLVVPIPVEIEIKPPAPLAVGVLVPAVKIVCPLSSVTEVPRDSTLDIESCFSAGTQVLL